MTTGTAIARSRASRGSWLVLLLLALAPPLAAFADNAYVVPFLTRVAIFGLAATGLNLALGFGGLTSLGHAAFMGVGAYAVGMLMASGVDNGWLHIAVVLVAGALTSLVIGALALRTSGISFIMLTLAFAQLLYFIATGLKTWGGDDGFSFRGRSNFGSPAWLAGDVTFYYVVLACLALGVLCVSRIVASRFGAALAGIKSNEARMASIGLHPYRYKLVAFVVSGTICAVAGGLLAELTQFVSPSYMHWSRSAELLLMVLLGGMASGVGPLLGAVVYLCLEEALGRFTTHWQAPMGLILVAVVLFAREGIADAFGRSWSGLTRGARRTPAAPPPP